MPTELAATGSGPTPAPEGPQTSRRVLALALLAAVGCGAVIAAQSRFTGRMSEVIGPLPAAWWSFGSGWVLLTAALAVPAVRRHLARVPRALREGRLRWWQLLGGVFGGLLVATQAYAVPIVGISLFLVALVGGQTVNALVVDRFGVGPAPAVGLTPARVLAAGLAVVGVTIAAVGGSGAGDFVLLPVLLAFAVGLGAAFQQAINGRVNRASGDPLATAWINFTLGCLVLLAIGIVPVIRSGVEGLWTLPWWAYLAGVCGVVFIATAAWAVAHSGVLLFGLVSISSQLGTALLLDLTSPADRDRVGPALLIGVAVTACAAVWAAAAAQRARARSRGR